MAVLIDSPRGKGFTDCEAGKKLSECPYWSYTDLTKELEWTVGWYQAYQMGRFGRKSKT